MSKNQLRKGFEIEVSSEEDGLEGAWFKAFLKDVPGKSGRKKLSVVYKDLEAEDGKLLQETVYQRFIRPVPPENLFSSGEFEECSVVEAKQRDAWWTCVFVKKLEEDKYLVYCDSPPDLISFKREQLREHFDWVNEEWVRPQKKQLSSSCGTMVEVMEELNDDVVCWIPSVVVKEKKGGKDLIVKSYKYLSWNDEVKPARTVSSSKIRLVPPPLSVESYESMEQVEVFIDPGWREGIVKDILCDNKYTVSLDATNELLVFQHSNLRPSKESISKRFMGKSSQVNDAISPQRSLSSVENGEAVVAEDEATREPSLDQGSGDEMVDDVRNDSGTSETEGKAQGKTMSHENQNELGNDSTRENERSEDNNRKRKREETFGETRANDSTVVLPFEKTMLSTWKEVESMEAFKMVPQTPHFSPLVKSEESCRETSAIGMMYTYCALIEEAKGVQVSSPISKLKGLRDSFAVLEKNGFDVKGAQSRIHKLLSLKVRLAKKTEKEMEQKMLELQKKREEEDKEFEQKILEMQKKREEADKETAEKFRKLQKKREEAEKELYSANGNLDCNTNEMINMFV